MKAADSGGSRGTSVVTRTRRVAGDLRASLSASRLVQLGLAGIAARFDRDLVARVEPLELRLASLEHQLTSLEHLIRQFHDDDWSFAAQRQRSINELLSSQHQTTWDSDRRLHDTLLRRLATIERAVRGQEVLPPPGHGDVPAIAAHVSDFLRVPDDSLPSVRVQVGTLELEVPSWDTVIRPWLVEHSDWEPLVRNALEAVAKPGYVAIDIGAHVGIFTLALSRLVGERGRVVAVEADPVNARFLRRNVAACPCNNVLVLPVAASDHNGIVQLSRSTEDNTGDSRTFEMPTAGQVLEVPCAALDDIIAGPVHLVKIDLQGTDHIAMRGMSRILRVHRPSIVAEFWPAAIRDYGDDPEQVLSWFRELGYAWQALEDPAVNDALPDMETCRAAEALSTGYVNLLLQPAPR